MIEALLSKMIKTGDFTAHLPGGRVIKAGDGTGPPVAIRINGRGLRRLANPSLGLGEGYMEGDIVFEQGTIDQLLTIVGESGGRKPKRGSALTRFRKALKRRIQQVNDRVASRKNVSHHYDLSNELYRRFLDTDMQYSCAYFERPDMTLEEAQEAKKALIGRKLLIEPGMKTLDIGSGWGGLSMTLAKDFGAQMTGVTLSTEQLALAKERAEKAGLADKTDFRLTD
jgi:cyclopropane-fatty-acyl-phospholipid synthase